MDLHYEKFYYMIIKTSVLIIKNKYTFEFYSFIIKSEGSGKMSQIIKYQLTILVHF